MTLIEVMVSALLVAMALAAIFTANSEIFYLLKRSQETVAARQYIQSRLDAIKGLGYAQICRSSYFVNTLLASGTGGDALPNAGIVMHSLSKGSITETIAVYAMGAQVFDDHATSIPIGLGTVGSEAYPAIHPAADGTTLTTPVSYISTSLDAGAWDSYAFTTPAIMVTRTSFGSVATVLATLPGDLTTNSWPPALVRIDVKLAWTGASGSIRTAMTSMLFSQSPSLQ